MDRERLGQIAQGDFFDERWPSVSFDEWKDILSLADDGLTFRMLNEQGHIVEFTEHGYGLEHPVKCRINARLLDCDVQVAISKLHENPFGEFGRYRVVIGESGVLEGWKLP